MAFTNPLDVQEVFVNLLSGNATIFLFLAFIVIAIMAARFKMPGGVLLMVFLMFAIIFAGTFIIGGELQGLVLLILTGLALVIAIGIGKGFSQI